MRSIAAVALASIVGLAWPVNARHRAERTGPGRAPDSVVFRNQAWSPADRETFYQLDQGSRVIAYDIFLNVEVAGSEELFRSDANSDRYGLIPQPANPRTNPDGLPIGLTKTVATSGRWQDARIGMTCSVCHTAELHYRGARIRIDGGTANTFDYMAYVRALDDAMQATLTDSAKFARLAGRLGAVDATAVAALRARFAVDAARVRHYRTRTLVAPTTWGPGRIDAIALIVNRMTADEPGIPENWSTPLAPTKAPFVWNTPQSMWIQWRASQQDPIQRNFTEVLGVFGSTDLRSATPTEGLFESSAPIEHLHTIDRLLRRLAPPQWPESVLGKIDRARAMQGKQLFAAYCASCHNAWPYTWTAPNTQGKRFIEVGLVPQEYLGTDPGQFDDLRPYAITGQFAPFLPAPYAGATMAPSRVLYAALETRLREAAIAPLGLSDAAAADLHGYRDFPLPMPYPRVYKAGPRDGVWATPPYLHNGSVPNLYEMLLPAHARTKRFYIGREFDPVRVGLDMSGRPGDFLYDTRLPGNSNAGHSFEDAPLGRGVVGPLFTDAQRFAIIEYLKSIPERAGRVTPFGGPPNARTGGGKWTRPRY